MADTHSPRVAIVDYGMGNLYSVERASAHVGLAPTITGSPADVLAADAVILPGVGAMPDAMRALDASGMSDALRTVVARGTPFLGVCLGMQLLMREGSEFGAHEGLGVIDGTVVRFDGVGADGRPLKVPHIGWSPVHRAPRAAGEDAWRGTPLADLPEGVFMYFVHSYYVVPRDPAVAVGLSTYGPHTFCSALAQDNVFACQFHPERSGDIGLNIYRAFAAAVRTDGASITRTTVVS